MTTWKLEEANRTMPSPVHCIVNAEKPSHLWIVRPRKFLGQTKEPTTSGCCRGLEASNVLTTGGFFTHHPVVSPLPANHWTLN